MKLTAKAKGMNLPISTKDCIIISDAIRGKDTKKARKLLEEIISLKKPLPSRKFTSGHKRGIGNGKFPVSAAKQVLKVMNSAEHNAQQKGLNKESLVIAAIIPNRAQRSPHYGRKRGIVTKASHIEIVVKEGKKAEYNKGKKTQTEKKKEERKEVKESAKPKEKEKKKEETEKKKQDKVEKKTAKKEEKAEGKKAKMDMPEGGDKK